MRGWGVKAILTEHVCNQIAIDLSENVVAIIHDDYGITKR